MKKIYSDRSRLLFSFVLDSFHTCITFMFPRYSLIKTIHAMFKRWDIINITKYKEKLFPTFCRIKFSANRSRRVPGLDRYKLHRFTCHSPFTHSYTYNQSRQQTHTLHTVTQLYTPTHTHTHNDMIMNMHEFYLIEFRLEVTM